MKKFLILVIACCTLTFTSFTQELVERRVFIESKTTESNIDQHFQSFVMETLKTEALALNTLILVESKESADILLSFTYSKIGSIFSYTLELNDLIQNTNSFTYSDTIKTYSDEVFLENIKVVFFQKTAKAIVKIPQKIREELSEKTVTQIEYKDTSTGISATIIGIPKSKLYFYDGMIKEIPENGKLELNDIPQNTDLIFTAKNILYFDLASENHLGYTDAEIKITQIPIPRFSIASSLEFPYGVNWALEYLLLPEGLSLQIEYLNSAYPQMNSSSDIIQDGIPITYLQVNSQKIEFSTQYSFFKPDSFFQFKLGAGFYTVIDSYEEITEWSRVVPIAFTTEIKPEFRFFRELSIFLSWKPSLILFSRAMPNNLISYNQTNSNLSEVFGKQATYALTNYFLLPLGLPSDLDAAYKADPDSLLYTENSRYNYLHLLEFSLGIRFSF